MVISQPENNPSYYYRASPTLPQLLWMLQEHLMFYTCNYNIRIVIEMVLLTYFLHESDPRRDHQQVFFIHFVAHALALHLAVKILLRLSVWRFEHVNLTYICRLYFLRNAAGPTHFLLRNNTLFSNNYNIWHKSSTKHRRSDQIETIKTIMQTTRPRIPWKVLPMAQVAIFKNIRSSAKRFRLWIVLFWTKTSQRLTLYLLSSHR